MYTASTWRRIIAYLIDQAILGILFLPVWIQALPQILRLEDVFVSYRWIAAGVLVQFLYCWMFLYYMGATIGKLVMGVSVRGYLTDAELTLMQSLLRVLTDSLSFFFSLALRALALIRFDRRQVADWVAETWVRQRHPPTTPPRPHWVLAVVLFVYFTLTGFYSVYGLMARAEFQHDGVVVHMSSDPE